MARTYRIRKFANGHSKTGEPFMNYSLTIPGKIAEKIPEEVQFECALTEEGILFRPVKEDPDEANLPSWAQNGHAAQSPAPRRRTPAKK